MDIQALYRLTTQREATLKSVIRSRPTEVQEIENLRGMIREAYVKMLFLDPIYAASKDMEQSLWKTCFYRKIEDFRKKIRKYAAVASSADNKALANKARNDLHAVCAEFSDFIAEAISFYQDLMGQYELLQAQQEERKLQRSVGGLGASQGSAALDHDCVRSIHRCLIFLGDLARYRELHSESTRKDWSQAEKWYYQAIDVMPTSGNPHNQLAVLATYTEAECVAVYRYCRALLCDLPFPTAKENLSLLFEKNKQNVPDPRSQEGAEELEEEERVRQGLRAGTITGQQAGIARATMLKSLLQRFVRLHGMLFSNRQQVESSSSSPGGREDGPFPVADFLGMLHLAMTDLRQLLKMSAFGDGLLLHMVVICVFSVLTSMADTGDHEASLEDSSVQSLSLSLAFGVVAEIAACVRTVRQESEHTTAKPPGSRLLGPVVVFCDWISSRPSLWRLKPLGSSSVAGGPCLPEKEKEAALREQFWVAICKVATELQPQLRPYPAGIPEELVWTPREGKVLKEQHDLRGFEPLHDVYGQALMTRPKQELGLLEIVSDDLASSWRCVRLTRFLREVGAACGTVAVAENPKHPGCWVFASKGRENAMASAAAVHHRPMPFATAGGAGAYGAYARGGASSVPASAAAAFRNGNNGMLAGGDGMDVDEVIVFKPSFGGGMGANGHAPAHAAMGIGAMGGGLDGYHRQFHGAGGQQHQHLHQQLHQQQFHHRQPSLDDSSQLPKDVVESMLGGLLDCSDSGPHPAAFLGGARAPPSMGQGAAAGFPRGPFGLSAGGSGATSAFSSRMALPPASLRSSGGFGWSAVPGSGAAASSANVSLDKLGGAGTAATMRSSVTPPPPGLALGPDAGTLAAMAAGTSMFAAGGLEHLMDGGDKGRQQHHQAGGAYNPFGSGLTGIGGGNGGQRENGRHSAPPEGIATKNPFMAVNGFMFAP